jgi:prepilin-type N-terminal cleavage/methylation domain-containing protein
MNAKRQKGFTLIELLVVIGIITVLLGILVPSLGKVRQIARRTMCKAQLHSVAQAFRMYLDDNRNTMPPGAAIPWKFSSVQPWDVKREGDIFSDKQPIVKFLGSYLSVSSSELSEADSKKCYAKVLSCPGDSRDGISKYYFKIQQSSYWYNERLGGSPLDKTAFRRHSPLKDMEIMGDFDAFHGAKLTVTAGERYDPDTVVPPVGSYNYLFGDCHVGDRKGF